jgi:putative DNA primase/helicase
MLQTTDESTDLSPISIDKFRAVLAEHIICATSKTTPNGTIITPCVPPRDLLATLLALGIWEGIPTCDIVTDVPVCALDGTIHTQVGYNPSTRAYLTTDEYRFERDIKTITQEEAIASANWFFEWPLSGFPFEDESSKTNALLMSLQHTVMPIISDNTPLCFIDAPLRSSGKTKLALTLSAVSCRHSVLMSLPVREEERQKSIVSTLLEKPSHVIFDNIKGEVSSSTLEGLLTSRYYTSRILGQSSNTRLPVNAAFFMTANNGTLSTDLATRSIYIRLDPETEKPEERNGFKIKNLLTWMEDNRAECVKNALTIIAFWIAKGQQSYTGERVQRQNRWAAVMGGIAESVGRGHSFLANTDALTERADEETMQWRGFVESWWDSFRVTPVRASDLCDLAFGLDGPFSDSVWTGDYAKRKATLGRWLQQRIGRIFSNMKIEVLPDKKNGNKYRLAPIDLDKTDLQSTQKVATVNQMPSAKQAKMDDYEPQMCSGYSNDDVNLDNPFGGDL